MKGDEGARGKPRSGHLRTTDLVGHNEAGGLCSDTLFRFFIECDLSVEVGRGVIRHDRL